MLHLQRSKDVSSARNRPGDSENEQCGLVAIRRFLYEENSKGLSGGNTSESRHQQDRQNRNRKQTSRPHNPNQTPDETVPYGVFRLYDAYYTLRSRSCRRL